MPRRILWLPEPSFRQELAVVTREIGLVDPEPKEELHATVAGAWPVDHQVRGHLPESIPAIAGNAITLCKYNNPSWGKIALSIFCEQLETFREQLIIESGKHITEPIVPHIVLSKTIQPISPAQISALWAFLGRQFVFTEEVAMTPGREKDWLQTKLTRSGTLLVH
jgi:hypothetical protein